MLSSQNYLNSSHLVTASLATLASDVDTNALHDGALITVTGLINSPPANTDKPLYMLVKTCPANVAANGTTVINTQQSEGGTLQGRWIRVNAAIFG